MENDAVLLVFAKAPEPGAVKTRLAGDTSVVTEDESARLYSAFLKDALAQYVRLAETLSHPLAIELHWSGPIADADPFVTHARAAATSEAQGTDRDPGRGRSAPESSASESSASESSGPVIDLVEQEGDGLGARMANAFQSALQSYQRAFILGTDHPTLPDPYIEEALHVLSGQPALCIGPSADGGYYGLGMNRWTPEVFADMTYSHAHVFKNTLRRAARTNVEVTVLPEFYDVDTPTALRRMLQDLRDTQTPARETRAMVEELNLYPRLGVSAG